jgi:hypothetical protein
VVRAPRFARLRPSAAGMPIRSRSTSAKPPRTAIISRPVRWSRCQLTAPPSERKPTFLPVIACERPGNRDPISGPCTLI